MKRLIILCVAVSMMTGMALRSDDTLSPGITRYLGLAMPYPDTVPELILPDSTFQYLRDKNFRINLTVDSAGRIVAMECPLDSAMLFDAIGNELKRLQFRFLPGLEIPTPMALPLRGSFPRPRYGKNIVSLTFPVSNRLTTDSLLLQEFFAGNAIEPPRITYLPPVTYVLDAEGQDARCWTVTAQLSLNEDGELMDITYPVPGQAEMAHQVHTALMRATYLPARLKGEPFAAEFLLTFRVFDNIDYPFSPFQAPDTTRPQPVTARYFMTYYYTENDISIFPLPRKHARGYIRSGKFTDLRPGLTGVQIRIDETGRVVHTQVITAPFRLRQATSDAVRLMTWYPAVHSDGSREAFSGVMTLEFNGSAKVVYIPEWFSP